MTTDDFQRFLTEKAAELYRPMPWRDDTRGYYVLVSEVMLQQTQVARVLPKFAAFIARFPDEQALARAPLAEVLELWQGLGYNRRARFLHEAAKQIAGRGRFPDSRAELLALPGVGANTAGAILAYSFNQPVVFLETNIRTVYLHHFFADSVAVDDRDITPLLEATLDRAQPREFYWGLMDYGAWLKSHGVRNVSSSKHYKKQSRLAGSVRQMRGQIIAALVDRGELSDAALRRHVHADERFAPAIEGLVRDQLVRRTEQGYTLSE